MHPGRHKSGSECHERKAIYHTMSALTQPTQACPGINKNDAMHLHGVNLCLGTQLRVQEHTPPRYITPLPSRSWNPSRGHGREVLSILGTNVSISRYFKKF